METQNVYPKKAGQEKTIKPTVVCVGMWWGQANSFLVLSTRSWMLDLFMRDACTFDSIELPAPSYLRQNFNKSFKLQQIFKVESEKHAHLHNTVGFPSQARSGIFVMLEFGVSFQVAAAAPPLFSQPEGDKCSSTAENARMQLKCEEATHAESEFPPLKCFWCAEDSRLLLTMLRGQLLERHQLALGCAEPPSKEEREMKHVAFRLHRACVLKKPAKEEVKPALNIHAAFYRCSLNARSRCNLGELTSRQLVMLRCDYLPGYHGYSCQVTPSAGGI